MLESGTEAGEPTSPNLETAGTLQQAGADAGRWKQYFATAIVCLAAGISAGAMGGWPPPMIVILKSPSSPVGPMDLTELSFLETLPSIAQIFALYLYGGMLDFLGRKWTGYLSAAPYIVGVFFTTFATLPYQLYIGRCLSGLGIAGLAFSTSVLLSEVIHSSRRGASLTSITAVANLTTLLTFILGEFLGYRGFNICILLTTVWFPIFFHFLPESPYYLTSKKKIDEAHKSMLWYRGGRDDVVDDEMKAVVSVSRQDVKFADILKTRSSRRAIVIVAFMFCFQQMGGSCILTGYASLLFDELHGSLSPMTYIIIMNSVKVVSTYFCAFIVDRVSRRFMLISTFFIMGITLLVVSICYHFIDLIEPPDFAKILLGCLCVYFLAFGVGSGTLPGVIGNEIVAPEIKGTLSMITGTITLVGTTLSLQAFPFVKQNIGMYANFAIPAVINLVGCFITYIIVPETGGMPLADIIKLLER